MRAIIQSYTLQECERIINGQQTIKVCKTAPKETPFKVYMYRRKENCGNKTINEALDGVYGSGKVIGEYVCEKVVKYDASTIACAKFEVNGGEVKEELRYNAGACLNSEEMFKYSKGKSLLGLYITNVKIYDKPKELDEFKTIKCTNKRGSCSDCKIKPDCIKQITRPPHGWQYVEGGK